MDPVDIVRRNTNEMDDSNYTSDDIQSLLDDNGGDTDVVTGIIWRMKAAKFSGLVNITEGPARQELGDLFKNAIKMAEFYEARAGIGGKPTRVHKIERT